MSIAKAGINHRQNVCKNTIHSFPVCTRRIILECYTFQYYVWNAHHLSLWKIISQFSLYNIFPALWFILSITDLKSWFWMGHSVLDLTDFSSPFCWQHSISEVGHNMLLILLTISNYYPLNVKCHFSVFQFTVSLEHWSVKNTVLVLFECVFDKRICLEYMCIS
jgi:hypothetical protein